MAYSTRPTATAVDALNDRLQSGQVSLPFETITGTSSPCSTRWTCAWILRSSCSRRPACSPTRFVAGNPRAIYFNDSVIVGVGAAAASSRSPRRILTRAPCSTACCRPRPGPRPSSATTAACSATTRTRRSACRVSRQERSERHRRQRAAVARQLPHRSSQSDRRAMGRLVRDRRAGRAGIWATRRSPTETSTTCASRTRT